MSSYPATCPVLGGFPLCVGMLFHREPPLYYIKAAECFENVGYVKRSGMMAHGGFETLQWLTITDALLLRLYAYAVIAPRAANAFFDVSKDPLENEDFPVLYMFVYFYR